MLALRPHADGVLLPVRVVPGASRTRIVGELGGALKVAVAAPPEKGRANRAVADLLARALGLSRGDVRLIAGATSPRKTFLLVGVSPQSARDRLR